MYKLPLIAAIALATLASCSGTPVSPVEGKQILASDCRPLNFPSSDDAMSDISEVQAITAAALDLFVDASETEATECAASMGLASRVVERDGESLAVTMDYSPTRVNFSIERGIVTAATVG